MTFFRIIAVMAALLALGGCATKFRTYDGPQVTQINVFKTQRKLTLLSGARVLKSYDMGLGFAPVGHKQVEGDGRTPEGLYWIDRRNPDSRYHLSIGLSYPNGDDVAAALALNQRPGGDIFIHGRGKLWQEGRQDWTWGCIAVTDREIEEIYAMVKDGTPIMIYP